MGIKKAPARKQNYTSGKGGANRIIQLPNGALVISFEDKSIEIWEEKSKARGAKGCACCTIF